MKDKLRKLVLSWDFALSALVEAVLLVGVDVAIPFYTATRIYEVAIGTQATIFAVYFAVLAIIITAGDNEFVRFLQSKGHYEKILWLFEATFSILSISLVLSLFLYVMSLNYQVHYDLSNSLYPSFIIKLYAFFFLWSLLACLQSSKGAIGYARLRSQYLALPAESRVAYNDPAPGAANTHRGCRDQAPHGKEPRNEVSPRDLSG